MSTEPQITVGDTVDVYADPINLKSPLGKAEVIEVFPQFSNSRLDCCRVRFPSGREKSVFVPKGGAQ